MAPAFAAFCDTIVKNIHWTEQGLGTMLEYDLMHKDIPCASLTIDPDSEGITSYQIEFDGMAWQRCFQ